MTKEELQSAMFEAMQNLRGRTDEPGAMERLTHGDVLCVVVVGDAEDVEMSLSIKPSCRYRSSKPVTGVIPAYVGE